ncbi:uncharacterized protein PGTG_00645 [Puccinia graminis f. sp. tritici CRL 75-36-700-3]|uniref:Uncharacterized protein n=1 Tax=Puccinia graminis f. sp. tritici (strain CRL 75-36-700-3 / race SCCL) TaxID=418459 RepID=E3JQP0_PUCGT|nr:uncharacterized protein PGTG_00645 [Puccinia graminis f. sp. tritici CRL 75-36-700-3]EFP74689.1 hypothetical protein PGTG_00645 [Puccinia graminis f. sp. tritici CRL 75-36-700-3]
MQEGQRRRVGLYYEEWLLPERDQARRERLLLESQLRVGPDIGRGDDSLGRTLSVEPVGQADVLARLDAGFCKDHYETEIDWRSDDGNGAMEAIPVGQDDFDERFSDLSLNDLAELVQSIRVTKVAGYMSMPQVKPIHFCMQGP